MKSALAGVLTLLVIVVGILGGCKSRVAASQQNLSQRPSTDASPSSVSQSEEKSDVAPRKDDDSGNATGTATRFTHLSGLHSGLSQDEVMPYVKRYFGTESYRGDCAKNDEHCYFSSYDLFFELMFNDQGKLYRIRDTPDTPALVAVIKKIDRPMLDQYFGQSSKRRTKHGETLLEWKKGSESACFVSVNGLFQMEYTDDSLKPQGGVDISCGRKQ